METEVLMKRELFGMPIHQKSKSSYFSATDLVKAGNKWRMLQGISPFDLSKWFLNDSSREFIKELESREKCKVKIASRGRGHHTWVHPYLFIDIALSINPKLKVEVYSWLEDELLKYRNKSGDSYKRFSGSVFNRISRKVDAPKKIIQFAIELKSRLDVTDWESCDEDTLKLRDRIQDTFSTYTDILTDVDEAFRLAMVKHIK